MPAALDRPARAGVRVRGRRRGGCTRSAGRPVRDRRRRQGHRPRHLGRSSAARRVPRLLHQVGHGHDVLRQRWHRRTEGLARAHLEVHGVEPRVPREQADVRPARPALDSGESDVRAGRAPSNRWSCRREAASTRNGRSSKERGGGEAWCRRIEEVRSTSGRSKVHMG